jgi:hypothetical protein
MLTALHKAQCCLCDAWLPKRAMFPSCNIQNVISASWFLHAGVQRQPLRPGAVKPIFLAKNWAMANFALKAYLCQWRIVCHMMLQ